MSSPMQHHELMGFLQSAFNHIHLDEDVFARSVVNLATANTGVTLLPGIPGQHFHVVAVVVANAGVGTVGASFFDGSSSASNLLMPLELGARSNAFAAPFSGQGYPLHNGNHLLAAIDASQSVYLSAYGYYEAAH